jgi:alcohol dehydrogenase
MKGIVLKPNHVLSLEEVPEPKIEKPDDVIVRVTTTTICGSDIHIKHGLMPWIQPGMTIGHEFVGIIEETGSAVRNFKPGDRVASPCVASCGVCSECRRGYGTYCVNGGGIWGDRPSLRGAQAEFVRAPWADMYLIPMPESVSDDQAVFVGDIFSTGFQAAHEGHISPGDTVVIFGCGPVGICALASAGLFGPKKVFSVDMLDNRLALTKQYGAIPIDAREGHVVERIKDATGGIGADVVIEAIGTADTFKQALQCVRRSGTVSVVGLFPGPVEFPIHELGFYGVRLSMGLVQTSRMSQLMGLLESKKVDLTPLATHTFSLKDAMDAYELFEFHPDQCVKVLLKP